MRGGPLFLLAPHTHLGTSPALFVEAAMPLVKSSSKAAFKENVRREIAAGRPTKQAVAIAYSVKRSMAAKHVKRKK